MVSTSRATMPKTLSPAGMLTVLPVMSLGLSKANALMPMAVPETVLLSMEAVTPGMSKLSK